MIKTNNLSMVQTDTKYLYHSVCGVEKLLLDAKKIVGTWVINKHSIGEVYIHKPSDTVCVKLGMTDRLDFTCSEMSAINLEKLVKDWLKCGETLPNYVKIDYYVEDTDDYGQPIFVELIFQEDKILTQFTNSQNYGAVSSETSREYLFIKEV